MKGYVKKLYDTCDNMLLYKMAVDLNILGHFMQDRNVGNLCSACIICIESSRAKNMNTKFLKKSAQPNNFTAS